MVFDIFPEGGLERSILPSIWVGAILSCVLNARLGWSLSGVKVPGYLVAILLVRPSATALILMEALLTFFSVQLLSEKILPAFRCSPLFGKDKFFAVLSLNALVHVTIITLLVPHMPDGIAQFLGFNHDLGTIGLLVSSLTANYFLKPGLVNGTIGLFIVSALTFLLVRFGLMEFTNYQAGSLYYSFFDAQSAAYSTPKAYMILIGTTLLISVMNGKFGWLAVGSTFPALLAMSWGDPFRMMITLFEVFIVFSLGSLVLQFFSSRGKEVLGASKLLVFLLVSVVYKLVSGHLCLQSSYFAPNDFFGFSYLLTVMSAYKLHDKGMVVVQTSTAIVVSAVGFCLVNVVGMMANPHGGDRLIQNAESVVSRSTASAVKEFADVSDQAVSAKSYVQNLLNDPEQMNRYIAPAGTQLYTTPQPEELRFWISHVINPLIDLSQTLGKTSGTEALSAETKLLLNQVAESANTFSYDLKLFSDKGGRTTAILIQRPSEKAHPARYWGTYLFGLTQNHTPLTLVVPRPYFEDGTLEYGLSLFEESHAQSLFISGTHPHTDFDGSADASAKGNLSHPMIAGQEAVIAKSKDSLLLTQVRSLPQTNLLIRPVPSLYFSVRGLTHLDVLPKAANDFFELLRKAQPSIKYANGDPASSGISASSLSFPAATERKNSILASAIWLSPEMQKEVRDFRRVRSVNFHMQALGIPDETPMRSIASLSDTPSEETPMLASGKIMSPPNPQLVELIDQYLKTKSILPLASAVSRWKNHTFSRLVDKESGQSFLLVKNEKGKTELIANLWTNSDLKMLVSPQEGVQAKLDNFIHSHSELFYLEEGHHDP